jgi:hypothetical protein
MPVTITRTAVNDGRPPSRSAESIGTGAFTDFGASEISVLRDAPNIQPIARALVVGFSKHARMLVRTPMEERRTFSNCR